MKRLEALRNKRQQQVKRQLEAKESYVAKVTQLSTLADLAQEKLK